MNKNIGLLLPRSVMFPSIAFDMMGGLKSGLENAGISDITVKTVSIGLGSDDKVINNACEQLLFDGVSLVFGYVNPTSAEKLEPLFASANAVFVALDAGYHFPSAVKKLSHVFYLSLQGALCIRCNVRHAMEDGMKRMAYVSSFYDSGYRSAFAVHGGLTEPAGVTYNLITPLKRADFSLAPLAEKLNEDIADSIFAAFCGDMLQDFCRAASAGDIFKEYPVYGSSFVGDEQWLAQSPYPGMDVKTCVPWASGLTTTESSKFTDKLAGKNINVNIFSLLGWEAASIAAKWPNVSAGDAVAALEGFCFESPRGLVRLDAETHQCHAPVYVAWVKKNEETGNCILVQVGESPFSDEERGKLENDINSITGSMTSWFNAYGCIES